MLDSFADIRDTMTDAEISEASGVAVADVKTWRAALDSPPPVAPEKQPKRAKRAADDTSAPPVTPADPEADSAPASVRVTASRVPGVRFEGMKNPIELRFGDVYSGVNAAHLWANFRHAVERYPKG